MVRRSCGTSLTRPVERYAGGGPTAARCSPVTRRLEPEMPAREVVELPRIPILPRRAGAQNLRAIGAHLRAVSHIGRLELRDFVTTNQSTDDASRPSPMSMPRPTPLADASENRLLAALP